MVQRKRVGLALGGGVVRGMAHIGVLQVFLEAGIPIDMVSGTSAGAIMAFSLSAGHTPGQMEAFAYKMNWFRLLRPVWPLRGLASFEGMHRMITADFGDLDLSELNLPCVIATTDIDRGEPVYLRSGPAARAVQASCSVPGFISPVEWQDRRLCEGGIADMLPVSVLRDMGADYVIGVDIFVFKLRRFLGPLGYGLAGLEIALERSGGGLDTADCLISPKLSGMTYLRFAHRAEIIERGRQAAIDALPALRRDLGLGAGQPLQPEQSPDAGTVEDPAALVIPADTPAPGLAGQYLE